MIAVEQIKKYYTSADSCVKALDGVDLKIDSGSFVVLHGASGCGKTTLLMVLAGMQTPDSGLVMVDDKRLYQLSAAEKTKFRAKNIGFVFQMFHLIPYLNVLDNILVAGGGISVGNMDLATKLVSEFGLQDRAKHLPAQLSAGEKQRVAIARAVFNNPKVILADEPTGNLDEENTHIVLKHLHNFQKKGGTIILATHGAEPQQYAQKTLYMEYGKIVKEN